jgi:uncharacterized membrane protein YkvA (DUF1232 family)
VIGGFFRMVGAIFSRMYKPIPLKPIAFAAVLVVYLFSPIDILPDYIPFLGVIDDVVLLGFFLRSLQKEIRLFLEWEKGGQREQPL